MLSCPDVKATFLMLVCSCLQYWLCRELKLRLTIRKVSERPLEKGPHLRVVRGALRYTFGLADVAVLSVLRRKVSAYPFIFIFSL